jgi:predicted phosphodiesterase
MSKIAILSDIHANLPAFKAILRDATSHGVTQIAVLGDIVGYGASPAECVELCIRFSATAVLGNHDFEALKIYNNDRSILEKGWEKSGFLAGFEHAARAINSKQAEWLSKLPYIRPIKGAFIAHASLDDPEEFYYTETYENAQPSLDLLAAQESKVCFLGHTHAQEIFHHPTAKIDWENETGSNSTPASDMAFLCGHNRYFLSSGSDGRGDRALYLKCDCKK